MNGTSNSGSSADFALIIQRNGRERETSVLNPANVEAANEHKTTSNRFQ